MVDFNDLRAAVSIDQVFTEMLGVTDFKPSGTKQFIGTCPLCGTKKLKITPSMGLCNCFHHGCGMGGDIVKAVARMRKLSLADAGNEIAAQFGIGGAKPTKTPSGTPFDAATYQAKLDPEHEGLVPLEISSGIIREFGGGYCVKGKLGDRLALPLYEGDTITAFFGIALDGTGIKFARDEDQLAIFNANRLEAGEPLTVVTDPLAVLRAAENGDTQVVAIFTLYTADTLRRIAALMDRYSIEEASLF